MILVPIKTAPGMNVREHWRRRASRVEKERWATKGLLAAQSRPPIPCSVLLTRIAPSSGLDDDNLSGALKGVRDQVAEWLGVDDRHSATVRYRYAQRRGPWGVEIKFGPPASGAQLVLGVEVHSEDAF